MCNYYDLLESTKDFYPKVYKDISFPYTKYEGIFRFDYENDNLYQYLVSKE